MVAIVIPLAVGGLAALLTMDGMNQYAGLEKPPLAPPGWLFPIVWNVLFVLMGISSARVYLSQGPARNDALRVYVLQLFLNFGWTILYFGFHLMLAAFVWLLVLEAVIVVMIALFYSLDHWAGILQVPYFLWTAFAGYLNLATYLLNAP